MYFANAKPLLLVLLYILTFVSVFLFSKEEHLVALFQLGIVIVVAALHFDNARLLCIALLFGIFMAFLEYVCVRYKIIWKYTYAKYRIPLWLPFTWTLVVFFVYDVFRAFIVV